MKWSSYLHNYYAHLHPCTTPINPLASELMLNWVEMCFIHAKIYDLMVRFQKIPDFANTCNCSKSP